MPRTSALPRGLNRAGGGLAELLALINDALRARVTPAPVLAGIPSPVGGLSAGTTLNEPTRRAERPRPRPRPDAPTGAMPATPGAPPPDPDDDATAVAGEHVEIWSVVERAQNGDGEAFGQLYDRYVERVYRFVLHRVSDRQLAEDITSEAFLRALRRIGSVNYQGRDIGAWFITIARNIVLDHYKSARTRSETVTGDDLEPRETARSTESTVLDAMTAERLRAAVDQLGGEQSECIQLRFLVGLSVAETAEAMGKNTGAVKALQHRAVRKLADLVGDELAS